VDIGRYFSETLECYKKQPLELIVGGFLALLLGSVTVGILAGPAYAGFAVMLKRVRDGEKVAIGDVFACFSDKLGFLILVGLLAALLVAIGSVLCVLPGLVVAWLLMFAIPAAAIEDGETLGGVYSRSKDIVMKNVGYSILLLLVAGLVGALGSVACGLGALVTYPFSFGVITMAYLDQRDKDAVETAVVTEAEEV